jgi:hypothetical protein
MRKTFSAALGYWKDTETERRDIHCSLKTGNTGTCLGRVWGMGWCGAGQEVAGGGPAASKGRKPNKMEKGQVLVVHACNPSFSGARDYEDCSSKPVLANIS